MTGDFVWLYFIQSDNCLKYICFVIVLAVDNESIEVIIFGVIKYSFDARRKNSAAMFLTHVSPASPLDVCWLC
jgi:hypothetical protein